MATVLIGYATRSYAAKDVAAAIADEFSQAGHDARAVDLADKPAIDGAALVILGSGINSGSWYPEAVAWISDHADELVDAKVAVFNTCLNAADPTKRESAIAYNSTYVDKLDAVSSETFAGRYLKEKAGFFSRLFAKATGQKEEDLVDLGQARAWGRGLIAHVG